MARPNKPIEEQVKPITASVLPEIYDAIDQLSRARRWTRAKAAGYLIELGLQKLDEPKGVEVNASPSQAISAL
jgi:hypothetical protein